MPKLPKSVVLNTKNLKIESPEGFVPFLGINKITKNSYIHFKFSNGSELKCSEDHPLMTIEGIVKAKDLTKKIEVNTKNGGVFVKSKRHIKKKIDLYDIVNSGTKHLYYSNEIVSHNCEFLGSTNTLISGVKLQQLVYRDPIYEHDKIKIYEQPIKAEDGEAKKDHLYAITVDVSEGKNLDCSAFSVFDISIMPYKQVASYHSSSISPVLFPTIIYNAARMYNDAYVLVEINNTPQIAETLHSELEYENLWKVHTGNKKPQQLSAGFARGVQLGVKMSPQVKRIGCSNLKMLIEGDKLLINDFDTYSELTTFIQDKNSFAAEEGANDDLVMSLVIFSWATTQKYFKEIVNHDIRKQIQLEKLNQVDDDTLPEMIVEDGVSRGLEMLDGDLWETVDGPGQSGIYDAFIRDMMRNL
jgi:hypothetical protein